MYCILKGKKFFFALFFFLPFAVFIGCFLVVAFHTKKRRAICLNKIDS